MDPIDKRERKSFGEQIGQKEKRKISAQSNDQRSVWFGLGMFGMVGWSLAVPTLLGALFGIWLDKNYPQSFSWTLSCLILGLVMGAMVAAHWIAKENKEIHPPKIKQDE
ncbi:AtpZ/AtpI family protein [Algoriphagus persicinus]|uniref:AtpZ/AtpI family protein n=1 Tax=Algoriphagus persicinus TaxID=3108754 RepID=UPI002B39FD75|nr:AtpZ/AtpI family protein [Algoriphagus sp. E1-3-M2]MEB2787089.1 AtpZ/AtpI family protein [Algoriphagus sp. E1-3-M2]